MLVTSIFSVYAEGGSYTEGSGSFITYILKVGGGIAIIYFAVQIYHGNKKEKRNEAIKKNQDRLAPKVTKPSGTFYRFVIQQTATREWYYIDSGGKSVFHAINGKPISADYNNGLVDFVMAKECNRSQVSGRMHWDEIIGFKGERQDVLEWINAGYIPFKNSEYLKKNLPDIAQNSGKLLHEIY